MERTASVTGAMIVVVALAACSGSGNVTGPTSPGPAVAPGPGGGAANAVDIQGSGVLATEPREVHGFDRVTLDGVGHLIVQMGPVEALTIAADDNILPLVTAQVYGSELVLGTRSDATFATQNPIVLTLSAVDLRAVSVSGASLTEIRELDADTFSIQIDGAAAVTASGRTDRHEVLVAGVSRYDARALLSRFVAVDVSGVSGAIVHASDRLEGRVDGQSTVEYLGRPRVDVSVSGGASVKPLGE